MNTPREPRPNGDSQTNPLERLLSEALGALEKGGEEALEEFLSEHPEDAPALRVALQDLARFEELSEPIHQIPASFGDFQVEEELGAGGMGVVFLARQQSLDREVALKVVRPELLLFEGARERFRREIDAVARLEHPAIVPILATGNSQGVPYYAMPRLRGANGQSIVNALADNDPRTVTTDDLRKALDDQRDDASTDTDGSFTGTYWQAVVRLIRKAALGIQHAHLRGVLHRDLKPSNIVFTPTGQAIVLDFGLARDRNDPTLTRTGTAAGSPAYMAPEQVRGEPADERTDVYGLAATLHCLLGLRPPFPSHDSERLRQRILAGEREELAKRAGVPTELSMVLDCAMDLERSRRYESAIAFADDLQAVLDGTGIQARRLPFTVRARRFVTRHRTLSSVAAVVALFLVLLPSIVFWQQRQASEKLAEQERRNNVDLKQQVARADESVKLSIDAVRTLLTGTGTDKLRNRVATLEVVEHLLKEGLDLFKMLENDEKHGEAVIELRLTSLSTLAGVKTTMGKLEESERLSQQGLEILERLESSPKRELLRATFLSSIASTQMDRRAPADPQAIKSLLDRSKAALAKLEGVPYFEDRGLSERAHVEGLYAGWLMRSGKLEEAERLLRKSIKTYSQIVAPAASPASLPLAKLNLVRFLKGMRRYDEALAVADELLASLEDVTAEDEVNWPVPRSVRAMGLNERARLLQLQERLDESVEAARVAIDALTEVMRDYPQMQDLPRLRGTTHANLALIFIDRKDWDTALPITTQAVADQRAALQLRPTDPQALRFLANHLRFHNYVLRNMKKWSELEREAWAIGELNIPPKWREGAALDLLRCALLADEDRAKELRERALDYVVTAHGQGRKLVFERDLYDAIRDDPRFPKPR